jgi:hypothetical protein
MRGGNNPLLVELTSNLAVASGAFVPIPTFCAMQKKEMNTETMKNKIDFLIKIFFVEIKLLK